MTTTGCEPRAPTRLVIDLDAIAANWRALKERTAHGRAAAVVKANAYGCGLEPVARRLWREGARLFFVAHLDEALALRAALGEAEIAVFNGPLPGEAPIYAANRIRPVLNDLGAIEAWAGFCRRAETPYPALVHVDTGMLRLGLPPGELAVLADEPERLAGVAVTHVISHLACADTPDHPKNAAQRDAFAEAVRRLPTASGGAMLANSAGVFLGPDYHFDWIRPGYGLYGGRPNTVAPNPMRPAVALRARILQLRPAEPGDTVGYGASWTAERPSTIATLAVGYADGYLRALSSRARARLDGHLVPVVGRVSMDLITVDVTEVANVAVGDEIELIGPHYGVDDLADAAGTIGYEILTALGARYARVHLGA